MLNLMTLIGQAHGSGTAVANSSAAGALLKDGDAFTLPPAADPWGIYHIHAAGILSNIVTTPGTLTLDLKFGSVIVATSGALQMNTTANTNARWELDWHLRHDTMGSGTAAKLASYGRFSSLAVGLGSAPYGLMFALSAASATGFDSTAAQLVTLQSTFSVANAGNSIQLEHMRAYSGK